MGIYVFFKNMRWWSREYEEACYKKEYEEASRNACNKKGPSWLVRYSHPCGTDVAHTFLNEPHHPWQQSTRALLSLVHPHVHSWPNIPMLFFVVLINGQISSRLLVHSIRRWIHIIYLFKKTGNKLIFWETNWVNILVCLQV